MRRNLANPGLAFALQGPRAPEGTGTVKNGGQYHRDNVHNAPSHVSSSNRIGSLDTFDFFNTWVADRPTNSLIRHYLSGLSGTQPGASPAE